jgi:Lon protease-like protein
VPLTSKDWEKSLRVTPKIFGVSHIAVFTDGCQRAVLVKSRTGLQPYKKFFEPLFSDTQEIKDKEERDKEIRDFLSSKKMSESSEDDKTFVVAVLK